MTILNSKVTILLYDNYKKNTLKYKFTENPNFWFLTVFLGDLEGAVNLHSEAQLRVKKNKKLTLNFPSLLCFQRGQSQCFLQLAF